MTLVETYEARLIQTYMWGNRNTLSPVLFLESERGIESVVSHSVGVASR